MKEIKISGFQIGETRICLTYIINDKSIFNKSYRVTNNRKRIITTWNDKQAISTYWGIINEILNQTRLNI